MKISDLKWKEETRDNSEDKIYFATTEYGVISVLNRMTGWANGGRDTETGFRDMDGKFCLASGMFDIRDFGEETIEDAIELIKNKANNCIPFA